MGDSYAWLIGAAGVAFTVVQTPNLLRRSVRVRTSLACLSVAVVTAIAAVFLDGFGNASLGLVVWVFGAFGLSNKWFYEVQGDVTGREERGMPPLLRSRVIPVGVRSIFDGFWQLRYRWKMFRDPWSRRYLIGMSQPLPRSLMDGRTVAELEIAYREQDDEADGPSK